MEVWVVIDRGEFRGVFSSLQGAKDAYVLWNAYVINTAKKCKLFDEVTWDDSDPHVTYLDPKIKMGDVRIKRCKVQ